MVHASHPEFRGFCVQSVSRPVRHLPSVHDTTSMPPANPDALRGDARLVAAAVSSDACIATVRSDRYAVVRAGRGRRCDDPAGVAQALDIAATVVDVM